jgi:hypothetical protein
MGNGYSSSPRLALLRARRIQVTLMIWIGMHVKGGFAMQSISMERQESLLLDTPSRRRRMYTFPWRGQRWREIRGFKDKIGLNIIPACVVNVNVYVISVQI